MTAASDRAAAARDARRAAIMEAARRVFAERGLAGASLRRIAAEAGYTPAALYYYWPDKEHLYGAVLADSLAALDAYVAAAVRAAPEGKGAVAGLRAFYDYYRARPEELDLGLYLYRGAPIGLTRTLDRELNAALGAAIRPVARAYAARYGVDTREAWTATVTATTQITGILLMDRTGRLKSLGVPAEDALDRTIRGFAGA